MTYCVYKITNLINKKIYIGKAKNLRKRWTAHKNAANKKDPKDYSYIHRAISKYGFENFQIEKISEFPTEVEAFQAEMDFIKKFDSRNQVIGYNLTEGGEGSSGYKHNNETKNKMSIYKKNKYIGDGNPFFGKTHSDETKKIIGDKNAKKYKENKEKHNKLNIAQCLLTIEQCLQIQNAWLNGDISFDELAKKFSTNLYTIHRIIHGTYFAIKDHSIITKEIFEKIKLLRKKEQNSKYKKFTDKEELDIVNQYNNGIIINDIAIKLQTSCPTISKILKKFNIKTKVGFAVNPPKHKSNLSEDDVINIKNKYLTGQFSYPELGLLYNVSKQVIARIIQEKTFKNNVPLLLPI